VEYGLPYFTALQAITSNIADIFGVSSLGRITTNQRANFLLFDADPLSLTAHLQVIGLGNHVEVKPQEF